MSINETVENKEEVEKVTKKKKLIALKTTSIICNGKFELIEGEEIPKGIDRGFIDSLINSNLIK